MNKIEHKKMLSRERSKRWREANPERKKQFNANWEAKNPTYFNDYYARNKNKVKTRVKKYRAENPDVKEISDRKRRAVKYATRHETYTTKKILETYGTDCYICLKPIDLIVSGRPGFQKGWEQGLNIDHVIALKNGGTDTLDNLRPTHAICNLRKG